MASRRRPWRSTSPLHTSLAMFAAALLVALVAPAALSFGSGGFHAGDDTATVVEDSSVVIPIADLLADDSAGAVFSNLGQATNGFAYYDNLFEAIVYFPRANYSGTDTFTYEVTNGVESATASVWVSVTAVQDRPSAANDAVAGVEDTGLTFTLDDLFANDQDVDGDALLLASHTQPFTGTLSFEPATLTFTYVPAPDHSGTDTFIYTATDGIDDDSALVTITLLPTQDPPTAVHDTVAAVNTEPLAIDVADLLANDLDVDGDALSFVSADTPTAGTISFDAATARLTYDVARGFVGTDTFTYTITDGTDHASATVTVVVSDGNGAPNPAADAVGGVEDVDFDVSAAALLANDVDPDGDELWLVAVQDGTGTSVSTDGTVVDVTPLPDFFGTGNFTYTVIDAYGAMATGTVTVEITGTDDPVTAVDDVISTRLDTEAALIVSLNDAVVDGLGTVTVDTPTHGTLQSIAPNVYTYTPDPGATGEYTLTYTVTDVDGDTDRGSIAILVGFPDVLVATGAALADAESMYWSTVAGDAWIHVESTWTGADLQRVTFRLDGLAFGTAATTVPFAPLVDGGLVLPLDSTTLANGVHTFTAEFETTSGLDYTYLVPFFVSN